MVIGTGHKDKYLRIDEIKKYCQDAFSKYKLENKRILFIIPDLSRSAPIDRMFKIVYELLADKVELLDFLIALGTHPPLSQDDIYKRVGITEKDHSNLYSKSRFFNHQWKNPNELTKIGTILSDEVKAITNGIITDEVPITINKMVFNYDQLVIIGPTFPHEVVGFSGGNKYLFPGISGSEIIDMFHWLGALITNQKIIGTKYTPVRKVIDTAAAMLDIKKLCMSLVVKDKNLAGLYIGSPEEAWKFASELSDEVHIVYKDNPYHTVLSCAPEMYDDLWTGGKCMYKLEPVVADNGRLIIYAPHITEVSVTHGDIIKSIGYHVRDYFTKQESRFLNVPGGVKAHSTHVKGLGTYKNGVERPRIEVILATGISKEECEKINLGYIDHQTIDLNNYKDKENEGILFVPNAGELLYRLNKKD